LIKLWTSFDEARVAGYLSKVYSLQDVVYSNNMLLGSG